MRVQNEAGYYLMVELQGRSQVECGHRANLHFHPFWELIWAEEPVQICCGEQQLCARTVLLPPGVSHSVAYGGSPCRMLYLGFRVAGAPPDAQACVLPENRDVIDPMARRLLELPQEAFLADRVQVLCLLAALVPQLQPSAALPCHRASLVEKVRSLCSENPTYTVQQMADMLYISADYLSNVFRAETGLRIKEYQTTLRMEQALRLLVSTEQPVAAIARQLGYATPSYFIRCFEKHYHHTPGALRQLRHEANGTSVHL